MSKNRDFESSLPPLVDIDSIDKLVDALCDSVRARVYQSVVDAINEAADEIDADKEISPVDIAPTQVGADLLSETKAFMPDDRMLAYLSIICNVTQLDILSSFQILKEIMLRIIAMQTGKLNYYKQQLSMLGVNLYNEQGYMRFHEFFDSLANHWTEFEVEKQAWIARLIAGEQYAGLIQPLVMYGSIPSDLL